MNELEHLIYCLLVFERDDKSLIFVSLQLSNLNTIMI